MERIKILDTYVDNLSMKETVEYVDTFICEKKPLHLVGVNADKFNELQVNDRLKTIVNESDIVNADGFSVVWAAKVLGTPMKERVAGIDLMCELMELSEKRQYSVYFLGAKQEIVEKAVKNSRKMYPRLRVAGYRNGYFSKTEWHAVAQKVKDCNPDIVFIGISSPLKEYLVEYMQKEENINCVFMGVGGSFDVISGAIPRAPKWMQDIGFEWFFRFLQEPRRLGKRYFLGNITFVYYIFKEKFKRIN